MRASRVVAIVAIATIAVALPTWAGYHRHANHGSGATAQPDPTAGLMPSDLPSVTPSPLQSVKPTPSPRPRATVTRAAATRTPIPTPRPVPVPKTTPRPAPPPPPPPGRSVLVDYHGLGTWVDGYDFSRELGGKTAPSAVDAMAKQGIRTLYIQAAKDDSRTPNPLLSSDLLGEFLTKAHSHHMRVVAWYLPTLTDPNKDFAHVSAILKFRANGQRFDSIGLDIESRAVSDVQTRNDRLVAFSKRVRGAVGSGMPLAGIVLPPVVTDKINTAYWPNFPWHAIAPSYDVWLPMAYWTNRTQDSGYRNAYKYVHDNVALLRQDLGQPSAPVHVIGGIGDQCTISDYQGMIKAAKEAHAIGDSIYDWATTSSSAYATLRTSPT